MRLSTLCIDIFLSYDRTEISLKEPRDEFGIKVLNTFYDMDSGMMFCLLDAPDRLAVKRHHSKFGMKCEWITPVKMTSEYDVPESASE